MNEKRSRKLRVRIPGPVEIPQPVNLPRVEAYADKVMDPIDVEFTKHFFDRLTRTEHTKEITDAELIGFFKRLSKRKKQFKDFMQRYDEFVVNDNRTDINIPFKANVDQIIAKTVMRKSNFKTSDAKYKVENKNYKMKHIKLFEQFLNEAEKLDHKVKYSKSNNTYQVWLGDEIVTDFVIKKNALAFAKKLNDLQDVKSVDKANEQNLNEAKVSSKDVKKWIKKYKWDDEVVKNIIDDNLPKRYSNVQPDEYADTITDWIKDNGFGFWDVKDWFQETDEIYNESVVNEANNNLEGDAIAVINAMLPYISKATYNERKKSEGYFDLIDNAKNVSEGDLVDRFYDFSHLPGSDDYYDALQELINEYLVDLKILGDNASKKLPKEVNHSNVNEDRAEDIEQAKVSVVNEAKKLVSSRDIPVLTRKSGWGDIESYLKWLWESPYKYHIDDDPKDVRGFDKKATDILSSNSDIMWGYNDRPENKSISDTEMMNMLWDTYNSEE